jgi:hypothetical protein
MSQVSGCDKKRKRLNYKTPLRGFNFVLLTLEV